MFCHCHISLALNFDGRCRKVFMLLDKCSAVWSKPRNAENLSLCQTITFTFIISQALSGVGFIKQTLVTKQRWSREHNIRSRAKRPRTQKQKKSEAKDQLSEDRPFRGQGQKWLRPWTEDTIFKNYSW